MNASQVDQDYATEVYTAFDQALEAIATRRGNIDLEAIAIACRTMLTFTLASAGEQGKPYVAAFIERLSQELPGDIADAVTMMDEMHASKADSTALPN